MGASKVLCGTGFVGLSVDCVSHTDASFCFPFEPNKARTLLCLWATSRDNWNALTKKLFTSYIFAASYWPFDISLAEFPSGWREQLCVCVEGKRKGNMSHDHLLSEPNEAPFALSNLPVTSAALATNALVSSINPALGLNYCLATRLKTSKKMYATFK